MFLWFPDLPLSIWFRWWCCLCHKFWWRMSTCSTGQMCPVARAPVTSPSSWSLAVSPDRTSSVRIELYCIWAQIKSSTWTQCGQWKQPPQGTASNSVVSSDAFILTLLGGNGNLSLDSFLTVHEMAAPVPGSRKSMCAEIDTWVQWHRKILIKQKLPNKFKILMNIPLRQI